MMARLGGILITPYLYLLKAGELGLILDIAALAAVFLLATMGMLQATYPVMTVISPLMAIQYLFWWHCSGVERTTHQYVQAEQLVVHSEQSQGLLDPQKDQAKLFALHFSQSRSKSITPAQNPNPW
jgi:hypothetical protein